MYSEANLGGVYTQSKLLSDICFKRNPDICTFNENCFFIQTSFDSLMQKLLPSRLSICKFHLPWISEDIGKQMKIRYMLCRGGKDLKIPGQR